MKSATAACATRRGALQPEEGFVADGLDGLTTRYTCQRQRTMTSGLSDVIAGREAVGSE
jgi:hypothetical protein